MKKYKLLVCIAAMILVCVACGNNATNDGNGTVDSGNGTVNGGSDTQELNQNDDSENIVIEKDVNEILSHLSEKVQSKYNDIAKDNENIVVKEMTLVGGSNTEAFVGGPKKFDLSKEEIKQEFSIRFCIPLEMLKMVEDASGVQDGIMASNYTASAIQVTEEMDIKELFSEMNKMTENMAWTCGAPEWKLIYVLDEEYVITIFGMETTIDVTREAMEELFGEGASLLVDESF